MVHRVRTTNGALERLRGVYAALSGGHGSDLDVSMEFNTARRKALTSSAPDFPVAPR